MIDFVSVREDRICLWNDNEMVFESNQYMDLAYGIHMNGGLAPVVYRSSDWDDSEFREDLDYTWYRACKLV